MEEDNNNNTTLDPSLQKKHNDMLQRLSARHQSRPSSSSSTSSTSSFLTTFTNSKQSIDSLITESTDPSKLTEISNAIEILEKLLAENSYFLPSYEIRSSLKSISDLRHNLELLSLKLIPKKKFSFKTKPKPVIENPNPVIENIENPKPVIENSNPVIENSKPVIENPKPVLNNRVIRDSPGLRNKTGECLVNDLLSGGEYTLSGLDLCEVKLKGTVNSLFINRLRKCTVYTGPVIGSILIDDVEDCVFVLASHQIRIHCAKRSDFYLRVRSRPIIEDSNGVRFGPYCLRYDGIEEDLKSAGLEEETGNWENVDDFLWLRAVQSPNWSVLPAEERVSSVSISD